MEINRDLEQLYLLEYSTWKIEEQLLESFDKESLKQEINELEIDYNKERKFHIENLKKYLIDYGVVDGPVMDRYFVIQFYHIFKGGKELNMKKQVINRFKTYYKLHFTDLYRNTSYIPFDINSVRIRDVISMYIKLPNDLRRNIICPFHKERTGSFKIYEKNNVFVCFGCGKKGNAVNFISEIEKIEKKEAFKKLVNLFK